MIGKTKDFVKNVGIEGINSAKKTAKSAINAVKGLFGKKTEL